MKELLDEWSRDLEAAFDAVKLFDVVHGSALYRVFLLPGCLQLDLSLSPASSFGARGSEFRLLFGDEVQLPPTPALDSSSVVGHAIHHLLRARICIERGRLFHGEHWIRAVRDEALRLACMREDLPSAHGRGLDDLPRPCLDRWEASRVQRVERAELLRAWNAARELLHEECIEARPLLERMHSDTKDMGGGDSPRIGTGA